MEITIRSARPEDVPDIEAIAVAAWEPYYMLLKSTWGDEMFLAEIPDWRERKAAQVRSNALGERGVRAYVAEAEGQVVGFVTFRADENTKVAEIGNNAVHPAWQKRGIATKMYRYVLDRMRDLGMRVAKVTTGADPCHAPARAAYERVGFGRRIDHAEYHMDLES